MAKYNIKYLPKSQAEVVMNISTEEIQESYVKALNRATATTQLKGFRKGKAPKEMVEGVVGKDKLYEDALNRLLPEKLEESLKQEAEKDKEQKFIVLDYPKFDLKKEWKPGEELEVTTSFSLYPKVDIQKLHDLKLPKEKAQDISDEKVEESIDKIFEQYKKIQRADKKKKQENVVEMSQKTAELVDPQGNTVMEKNKEETVEDEVKKDDEFAKAAGAQSLEDLRKMVKMELHYNAEIEIENKYEEELVKKMASMVDVDIPDILIQEEMNRIEQRFITQLSRIGTTLETYLTSENKTKEDVLKEWEGRAIENAKVALILNEVKVKNDIPVSDAEISSLAKQHDIKNGVTKEQYTTLKYLIGQTKALNHIKKQAQQE
jgi:trigger factor